MGTGFDGGACDDDEAGASASPIVGATPQISEDRNPVLGAEQTN